MEARAFVDDAIDTPPLIATHFPTHRPNHLYPCSACEEAHNPVTGPPSKTISHTF